MVPFKRFFLSITMAQRQKIYGPEPLACSIHTFCMDMLSGVGDGQLCQMNPIKKYKCSVFRVVLGVKIFIPIYDKQLVPVAARSKT
jgi:hypothetical protein